MVKQDPLELYTIRECCEDDIEAICEIYNERVRNSTSLLLYEPVPLNNRRNYFLDLKSKGYPFIVVVEKETNQTVAYACLGAFRPHTAYILSCEISVYIHTNYQRRGLGRLLVAEMLRIAECMQFRSVIAGITAENTASIELFRSFGFTCAATFRECGFKFGRFLDVVFYELLLPETKVDPQRPRFKPFPWGLYRFGEPF